MLYAYHLIYVFFINISDSLRVRSADFMKSETYWKRTIQLPTGPTVLPSHCHNMNGETGRQSHSSNNFSRNAVLLKNEFMRDHQQSDYGVAKGIMKLASQDRSEKNHFLATNTNQGDLPLMHQESNVAQPKCDNKIYKGHLHKQSKISISTKGISNVKKSKVRKKIKNAMKRKIPEERCVKQDSDLNSSSMATSNGYSQKREDHIVLENDALRLALEMGYSNPNEKNSNSDQNGMKEHEHDEEEGSNKVSPVDNIQQILDYRKASGCACLSALTDRDLAAHRLEITRLERQSRDYFIMGMFRSAAVPTTVTSRNSDRKRYRFNYRLLNTRICQVCFLFVNNIGAKYMKNLKKHFNEMGVTSRTHGNQGRKPHHALQENDLEKVADFIIK